MEQVGVAVATSTQESEQASARSRIGVRAEGRVALIIRAAAAE